MKDSNPSQGFANAQVNDADAWGTESAYWRDNWSTRPYAQADRGFSHYEPGYRYGYESATRHRGRHWDEVEPELRTGWERYEHRGESTWEHMKDAVRDAWDRVTRR